MRPFQYRLLLLIISLLLVGVSLAVAGCFGGDDDGATASTLPRIPGSDGGASTTAVSVDIEVDPNAELSTFRSKDPFISQAKPATTTATAKTPSTSGPTSGPTKTTSKVTVTTAVKPGSSTTVKTSGGGSTTSTTSAPTSSTTTTAPRLHTLKILAASQVGGAAAVTFQVDGSVYKDRRVGDVVSTSWGQIKVLDVNTSSKVVTLLQGSETLILSVGQLVYQ